MFTTYVSVTRASPDAGGYTAKFKLILTKVKSSKTKAIRRLVDDMKMPTDKAALFVKSLPQPFATVGSESFRTIIMDENELWYATKVLQTDFELCFEDARENTLVFGNG